MSEQEDSKGVPKQTTKEYLLNRIDSLDEYGIMKMYEAALQFMENQKDKQIARETKDQVRVWEEEEAKQAEQRLKAKRKNKKKDKRKASNSKSQSNSHSEENKSSKGQSQQVIPRSKKPQSLLMYYKSKGPEEQVSQKPNKRKQNTINRLLNLQKKVLSKKQVVKENLKSNRLQNDRVRQNSANVHLYIHQNLYYLQGFQREKLGDAKVNPREPNNRYGEVQYELDSEEEYQQLIAADNDQKSEESSSENNPNQIDIELERPEIDHQDYVPKRHKGHFIRDYVLKTKKWEFNYHQPKESDQEIVKRFRTFFPYKNVKKQKSKKQKKKKVPKQKIKVIKETDEIKEAQGEQSSDK